MKIFVINPGSTSTKLALYEDDKPIWVGGAHHPLEELAEYTHIIEQLPYRKQFVRDMLAEAGISVQFDAVIARGGLLKPTPGGIYAINEQMIHDLTYAEMEHASNLGALIAVEFAEECQCPAYIADPVVADEFMPESRLTGIPEIERKSIFHALNSKAVSRKYAASVGKRYEDLNLIVVHLGGGISVAAHRKGLVIDCNNALDGEGPIAPERAGTIPAGALIDLCYSGQYSKKEARALLVGKGGLVALTGSNSVKDIMQRAEAGDAEAKSAIDAMIYTVAKQIGQMAVSLHGEVDAILLTGGIAHSKVITEAISDYCRFLAPIEVYPGENELQALAMNALRVLRGEMTAKNY